ncbi:MAG: phage holin family protein, partial [Pseudomonas sp.]
MESESSATSSASSKRLGAAVLGLLHGHVELFG